MRRVSFSDEIAEVANTGSYHTDSETALRQYFNWANSPDPHFQIRFNGYTQAELLAELNEKLDELDRAASMTLLSALEALFRVDFQLRCQNKKKDPLSRAFRELQKKKDLRVKLDEEILEIWKAHTDGTSAIIGELRSAFRYRHWLAHGRYWIPKLGRDFDFLTLYTLATQVAGSFPLLR